MFSGFGRKPIAQQLVVITLAALIAVFSILALVVQRNSDHAAQTEAPPSRILRIISTGMTLTGIPTMASAKMGVAPMA